ncbi:unnamed protein product [Urochloa humidicola]
MAPNLPPSSSMPRDGAGSSSAIVAGATSGYHVLRIEGYSRIKSTVPNGKHIQSRPFCSAGHNWAVDYYPNGGDRDAGDYISLFLVLKDDITDEVTVQFVFSFADQVEKQTPSYIHARAVSRFAVANGWIRWGRPKFIRREHLERSDHLRDDCFTVRCDMVVIGKPQAKDTAASPHIVVPPPDWPQHFRDLLLSEQGTDVRFHVGDETFAAHRCVLAARSPVFKAELFSAMKEGTATDGSIKIDGIEPQVFKTLLQFIYTESLPEKEEGKDAPGASMEQHLLEAADRYGMERLKLICEDRLCRHVDVSTVETTLALAEQHRCQGLKEVCFQILASPEVLDAVIATDGFQHLAKSCPSALVELMSKLTTR